MTVFRHGYLAVVVLLALTVLPNSFAPAGETITVHLASGREMTAEVDPRTDESRLWLRFGSVNTMLLRPINWSAIQDISSNSEPIEKAEILEAIDKEGKDDGSGPRNVSITISNPKSEITCADQARHAIAVRSLATHIDFEARLANWDNDPQPDGLLLHLYLLDADFRPVAASGSLQAELYAPLYREFNAVPRGRGASVLPIARWSDAVRSEDLQSGVAMIRLPFRAGKLTATQLVSSHGLLHVKFAVPGHGVFEASYDAIRILPFEPSRDILEHQGLRRILTTEPPRRDWQVR